MVKSFTEFSRVASPDETETGPSLCSELSNELLGRYVKKAKKSVKDMEDGPYDDHKDDKHFKRQMYVSYAKQKGNIKEAYHIIGVHHTVDGSKTFVSKPHLTRAAANKEHDRLKKAGLMYSRVLDTSQIKGLQEEKIRHPEHKKAYVEPLDGGYRASDKNGHVKLFNKLGKDAAHKHAGLTEEVLNELSPSTLTTYAIRASKSKRRIQGEKESSLSKAKSHFDSSVSSFYAGRDDLAKHHRDMRTLHLKDWNKHRKKENRRERGIQRAVNKIADKAIPVGVAESPLSFSEYCELIERQDLTPSYRLSVNWRRTKLPDVRHKKNKRLKGGIRTNKTQYVTHQLYKNRNQHDTLHLTSRSKHQLTDRWRDQRLVRMNTVKKNKKIHEDKAYLKNRQLLHSAHAQAGTEIGKKERDPELKRIHMHRARKHRHAAKVLEILRSKKK